MNIRTMTIKDYDQIYELWIHTEGMGLNNLDDSMEGIQKYLDRNSTTCFVAENESGIQGAILSGHDGRRGWIYHIAVRQPYRSQGIGQTLAATAVKALEAEGIHKAAMVVFEKNQIGNRFWDKLGFTARKDLVYRNKNIHELKRIDT